MNILFTNNDNRKKQLYELGFKMANKDAKCIDLKEAGLKNKVKFKLNTQNEAIEYSKECDYLTVSIDEALYIEGLNDNEQPGHIFKSVNIESNDNNIHDKIDNVDLAVHYADIVKKLGGTAKATWIDSVTIAYKGKVLKNFKVENKTTLTSKISKNIDKSNPINSITLVPEFGDIHYSDCNIEEVKFLHEITNKKIIKYISDTIKEIGSEE